MPSVMIVEDDPTILSNLSQLLELNGLCVVEAHDGQAALSILKESLKNGRHLPNLVVSDLMMPNLDGFELLTVIRSDAGLKNLPFVLLSARSDSTDIQQAFALGANDYLIKPFEVEQLMDVIRHQITQVLDQKGSFPTNDCQTQTDFFLE